MHCLLTLPLGNEGELHTCGNGTIHSFALFVFAKSGRVIGGREGR
jgi:hypothetical protein